MERGRSLPAGLAVMVVLLASTSTAHAEAPTDTADTCDPEASCAPVLGEDDVTIPDVRFADPRQVLFRVGVVFPF